MAERTGLPHVSVDDLAWRPDCEPVPPEEVRAAIAEICSRDRWILDSVYSQWIPEVMARVDLIVALDYTRAVSLLRLASRTARRLVTGELCCNGNRESFRLVFSRQSILVWHFRSFPSKRQRLRAWAAAAEGPPVLVFRRPAEPARWLASLVPQPTDPS